MIGKIIIYMIGYLFMVTGLVYLIIYLNFFTVNYKVSEYFSYIITRRECLLFPIGLIMVILVILFKKGGIRHD